MTKQKRNLNGSLKNFIEISVLVIALALRTTTATLAAADATPLQTTPTTSPYSPTDTVTPAGIFSDGLSQQQQQEEQFDANPDYDFYRPYPSDSHDRFSWELLKQVLIDEPNNVVISPFSVKLVLAMLSEAAGNNTKTQFELFRTLTDISALENLRSFYKKTLTSLKLKSAYYTLNLETRMYTDDFIEPKQKYAGTLKHFYQTDIEKLSFADAHGAADKINSWCSNATHGHLKELVNENSLRDAVMLIVNAIYFNGLWRREFSSSFPSVFFNMEGEERQADFMEQTEYFYYYESNTLDAKILRLPYKGQKFSMFIILPNTKVGIAELTLNLENRQVKRMQWMMEEAKVKLTLPKFKFDSTQNLKDTLKKLGVVEIFTDQASLLGLARGASVAGELKVSNIYQKSGIDVNEKGTEAYAATVVEIENKFGGSSLVKEFNVNRPFIFFIEEETTSNIIFAGKVTNPTL